MRMRVTTVDGPAHLLRMRSHVALLFINKVGGSRRGLSIGYLACLWNQGVRIIEVVLYSAYNYCVGISYLLSVDISDQSQGICFITSDIYSHTIVSNLLIHVVLGYEWVDVMPFYMHIYNLIGGAKILAQGTTPMTYTPFFK